MISLLCATPDFAQSYRTENGGDRFVQRLGWDDDPNVFKYEVSIERETGGIVERRVTTDNYIEVSLPPGRYKYTVDVYNLLDLFDYRMSIVPFEVLEALQPVVTGWTPNVFNLADGNNEVTFFGTNLLDGAQIFLVKNGSRDGRVVSAEIFGSDGTSARARLPVEEIEKGKWTVYITNPGGLRAVVSGFTVKSGKQVNIDLSVLYRPVIPVRSEGAHLFGMEFLGASSFLFDTILVNAFYQGAGLRFAWLPFRTNLFNFGFLVEPRWADLTTRVVYTTSYMAGVSASLLLQAFLLNKRLALHISMGGGILSLHDLHIVSGEDNNNAGLDLLILPFLDTGLSVKMYLVKSLFVELGISWNITPPFDDPDLQYLNPQAGIGYSF
ncbi:MAG: hypothetical protein LBG27_07240 [Spirochaetaceae bacterium]|nr:hypothetical protein [Spirochaetaceae bacterium]